MNRQSCLLRKALARIDGSRRRVLVLSSFAGLLLLGVLVIPAQGGATITVTTTTDEWVMNADCSLREAITSANEDTAYGGCPAGSGADVIVIPAGTYTITIEGLDNMGYEGDFDITSDMTLQGAGAGTNPASATILTSSLVAGHNILHVPSGVSSVTVTIQGLTVKDNVSGGYPGGMDIDESLANVTLEDCLFINNQAGANGGAIWNDGTLTVRRCTFDSNTSAGNGGAIYGTGSLSIYDSTFSNNQATLFFGGAIGQAGGELWIENSTLTGNVAGTHGGAIFYDGLSGMLSNVTISGNTADFDDSGPNDVGDGGGVYFYGGNIAVRNSIIAGNVDASTAGTPVVHPDCSIRSGVLTVTSDGYNLVGDSTGCGSGVFTDGVNGDQVGTSGSPLDPKLAVLAANGGPTETMELANDSPAIDTGNPVGCAGIDGAPLTADQRGFARPVDGGYGGGCDIGAVEHLSSLPPQDAPRPIVKIQRLPASIVRGSVPSGSNQWFLRAVLDDTTAGENERFQFVVWLYVPDDWQLPWATQYSFTGDFSNSTLTADSSAYSWVQTWACPLGGAPEPGYKWRAFRGPEELMTAVGDRLDNQLNLRGGLRVPVSEDLGQYQIRLVLGTYYDLNGDFYPDSYHCDYLGATGIDVLDSSP